MENTSSIWWHLLELPSRKVGISCSLRAVSGFRIFSSLTHFPGFDGGPSGRIKNKILEFPAPPIAGFALGFVDGFAAGFALRFTPGFAEAFGDAFGEAFGEGFVEAFAFASTTFDVVLTPYAWRLVSK